MLALPGFVPAAIASVRSARAAAGLCDIRLLADRHLAFWTVTRWTDDAALRRWQGQGTHGRAMRRLAGWCDQASVARWHDGSDAAFPDWTECHRRMQRDGHLSLPARDARDELAAIPAPRASPRVPMQARRRNHTTPP